MTASKLKQLLADDKLAQKIAEQCGSDGHDKRWCQACDQRENGIEDYRAEIKRRMKG